jgi:hypothetical protein
MPANTSDGQLVVWLREKQRIKGTVFTPFPLFILLTTFFLKLFIFMVLFGAL